MESFPDVSAVTKHPQFAARRLWGKVDSPTVVNQALLPPHNLRSVSPCMGEMQVLDGYTQLLLVEMRGTQ